MTTARLLVTAARFLAPGELSVIRNGIELEVFNREVKKALQQQAKKYMDKGRFLPLAKGQKAGRQSRD